MYPAEQIAIPTVPANDLDDLPPSAKAIALELNFHDCITTQNLWASAVRAYLASISFVDRQIGLLLDSLRTSDYADNTIVVLWSDHGFHLGEKFHWHKMALWERSTRIPFLWRVPGALATSARVSSGVSLVDMVPTLLELCNLSPPAPLSGRSIVPLLLDPARQWEHPVLTARTQRDYAVRTNRWRYIRYENGDEELYDHAMDNNEWNNLASDPTYASVMNELGKHIPR